jgi:hypothetical protein
MRQNLGSYFQHKGMINAGHSTFHYVFKFEYPKYQTYAKFIPVPECTDIQWLSLERCAPYVEVLSTINQRRSTVINMVANKITTLRRLIPAKINPYNLVASTDNTTRHRRSSFLGDWVSSLLGLPSQDEIDDLDTKLTNIIQSEQYLNDHTVQLGKHLAALTNLTDARFQQVNQAMQADHKLLKVMFKRQNLINGNVTRLYVEISAILSLIRNMASSQAAETQMIQYVNSWVTGVQTLLNGRLPVELIPLEQVKNMIQTVSVLQREHPSFALAHSDVAYYYVQSDIMFAQYRRFLYINVKIPIKSLESSFRLDRSYVVPTPMNSTLDNSTKLENLSPPRISFH